MKISKKKNNGLKQKTAQQIGNTDELSSCEEKQYNYTITYLP